MESAFCWTLHANTTCKFNSCFPSTKNNLLAFTGVSYLHGKREVSGIKVPQEHFQLTSDKELMYKYSSSLSQEGVELRWLVQLCLREFPYGIKFQFNYSRILCMIMHHFIGSFSFCLIFLLLPAFPESPPNQYPFVLTLVRGLVQGNQIKRN